MEYKVLQKELSYEQYHQSCIDSKALRSSYLKHLMKSPAHMNAAVNTPQEDKEHFHFGRKIHSLLENPEKFSETVIVEPEFVGMTKDGRPSTQSKEAREMKVAWYADLPKDANVVSKEEWGNITGIWNNVKQHKFLRNLLLKGVSEQSLWIKDPETGVTLACRPDFIAQESYIVDFKTTRDASPSYFKNQIFSPRGLFYVLGAAHYNYVLKHAGIGRGENFVYVALESTKPWGIKIYTLDAAALGPGEQWRRQLTQTYAKCLESDSWPNYDERAEAAEAPPYMVVPEFDDEY